MIPGKRYTPDMVLNIAWRRRRLILLPAVAIAVIGSLWIYLLPNVFRSNTLILVVPQRVPESYVRATVTTRIEDRLQSISQQILSRTRLEQIIKDFNLYLELRSTEVMEDIVEQMRKDITIEIVKGDAFRVSYKAGDPLTAMKVTERLASLFIDESLRDREALAEGTNQFLEAQLDEARRKLMENEKSLEEYRSCWRLDSTPSEYWGKFYLIHDAIRLNRTVPATRRPLERIATGSHPENMELHNLGRLETLRAETMFLKSGEEVLPANSRGKKGGEERLRAHSRS